ncbi:MAG: carbamoyl-phosphate synthase large subunit [Phycisphaerales bacterium]
MVVVEMNPRVSRSSALASKATGFPIAKIAAKLAVGYTLDELRNDITGTTSACFEPSIDYVVTKIPRWTFEKFPEADETLTTQMKSVGEAMAIGRTFAESFQKAIRSMEVKRFGLGLDRNDKWLAARRADAQGRTADGQKVEWPIADDKLRRKLAVPSQGRLYYVRYAYKLGMSTDEIHAITRIDRWFLDQIKKLVEFEDVLTSYSRLDDVPADTLRAAKQLGYSDAQLANLYLGSISPKTILQVRNHRKGLKIEPVYKLVDTCAAEFAAVTPYYYSTYETPFTLNGEEITDDEIRVSQSKKVVILGGGPNRIGQGIEFDYCCCHAAFAADELDLESVMINSNPETVSTDYDTSDLLFFEPLTMEDVLNVIERLNGKPLDGKQGSGHVLGAVVQFGGQTPLNLAHGLTLAGAPIIGTSVDSIDLAEDRKRFDALLVQLGLSKPPSGTARTLQQAIEIANTIGYPVLVRPSYVLGGRGMEICSDEKALVSYMSNAVRISEMDNAPVLIDRFLDDATEVDVDVVADFDPTQPVDSPAQVGRQAVVCGVMEHIEQAGIHSGDSACAIPAYALPETVTSEIRRISRDLAKHLRVKGLMNVQLAVKDGQIYMLEVNPRASRTSPFVGKATGTPWPRIAAKVMMGKTLAEMGVKEVTTKDFYSVKESVFPFSKFPGVDVVLGPEMRSTGEVMGIDKSFPIAFAKSQMAAGTQLPLKGNVFISVRERDRAAIVPVVRDLLKMGFTVCASSGTGTFLQGMNLDVRVLPKIAESIRPNILDLMQNGEVQLIINTPTKTGWQTDEGRIRASAVRLGVPMITTTTGAWATVRAIEALRAGDWGVAAIQDYFTQSGAMEPKVQTVGRAPARV